MANRQQPEANRCLRMRLVFALFCLLATPLAAKPAAAQSLLTRADGMLRVGRLFAAETLYYYAVRRAPRDPDARLSLGRYLAARGALKIGAVLMEEARFFGGDAKKVAVYLAPVYAQLGDYRSLAALPATPLQYSDRARAEWMRDNPPSVSGPDSLAIPYAPSDTGVLGTVMLLIGRDTVVASVDPLAHGLTLDTAWLRRKETKHFASKFDNDMRNFAGVTLAVGLGDLSLGNVVTAFAPQASPRVGMIGLDVLVPLAPTFDAEGRSILLRKSGRIDSNVEGEHIPTLTYGSGIWMIYDGTMFPLAGADALRILSGRRWTLNPRRGELIAVEARPF